jgi:hypothetical protein
MFCYMTSYSGTGINKRWRGWWCNIDTYVSSHQKVLGLVFSQDIKHTTQILTSDSNQLPTPCHYVWAMTAVILLRNIYWMSIYFKFLAWKNKVFLKFLSSTWVFNQGNLCNVKNCIWRRQHISFKDDHLARMTLAHSNQFYSPAQQNNEPQSHHSSLYLLSIWF